MHVAFALRIRLERNENNSLVRRRPRKTEAGYRKCSLRLLHVRQHARNLLPDGLRIFQRCPRRRLDHDDEISLILVGHEPGRHAHEHKISEPEAGEEQHRHRQLVFQNVMQQAAVPSRDGNDPIVKFLQPPPLLPVAAAQKNRSPALEPE